MIFFFSRIRRERGGICSCEKWGTEQRRRKRRQTWKCHKKPQSAIDVASERHEVSPGEGLMAHTDVSLSTTAAHRAPAGGPGCAPHGPTTHPHRQLVLLAGQQVLCTAMLPAHNALENISVVSTGTICTSAVSLRDKPELFKGVRGNT